MTRTIRVAAVGECMLELSDPATPPPALSFGGDTLNTAVYLARLLPGAGQVDYLTALGDDPYSEAMLAAWRAEGIGTGLVARLPGRLPGLYVIRTDAAGERSFYYWRSASAARRMLDGAAGARLCAALPDYGLIYLSGITLSILAPAARRRLLDAVDVARGTGSRVAFDINYRPRGWRSVRAARTAMEAMIRRADIALPGLEDLAALYGVEDIDAAADRLGALGVGEICVKAGGGVCLLRHPAGEEHLPPLPDITAVDTTAAGDSFNAGYLAGRLCGQPPAAAAAAGHRLAAEVIQHRGAIIDRRAMPGGLVPAPAVEDANSTARQQR